MKKLHETINAENWTQIHLILGERRCLLGHLIGSYPEIGQTLRVGLIRVADLLFPGRSEGSVSGFNDHPETTVEDVIRVCKVADV